MNFKQYFELVDTSIKDLNYYGAQDYFNKLYLELTEIKFNYYNTVIERLKAQYVKHMRFLGSSIMDMKDLMKHPMWQANDCMDYIDKLLVYFDLRNKEDLNKDIKFVLTSEVLNHLNSNLDRKPTGIDMLDIFDDDERLKKKAIEMCKDYYHKATFGLRHLSKHYK